MPHDWIEDFNQSLNAWNRKHIITSPDIDGILSACLLCSETGAKLAGIYTTKYLVLFDGVSPMDVKNAMWLDHDISQPGIKCMGQHLILHSELDKLPTREKNSFNPNHYFSQTWKKSFKKSNLKKGKRDKYPFATVHFLMAGLKLKNPQPFTEAFHLVAHADSTWLTCLDYENNAEEWMNLMFDKSNTLLHNLTSGYTDNPRNLEGHSEVVKKLAELGISKRSSATNPDSKVPDKWKHIKGHQSIGFAKNSIPEKWLPKFGGIIEFVSKTSKWDMESPKSISGIYAGLRLILPNRSELNDGDFDKFMKEEGIFSHAITSGGGLKYTKKFSINKTISCMFEIDVE
ncbi:MAG: hypothetical protein VX701_08545 [Chloroflexota bacterium]|nr:hypothetical protein [Chloroflexota bacterium]